MAVNIEVFVSVLMWVVSLNDMFAVFLASACRNLYS